MLHRRPGGRCCEGGRRVGRLRRTAGQRCKYRDQDGKGEPGTLRARWPRSHGISSHGQASVVAKPVRVCTGAATPNGWARAVRVDLFGMGASGSSVMRVTAC